jgi:hypothetical protein
MRMNWKSLILFIQLGGMERDHASREGWKNISARTSASPVKLVTGIEL